MKNKTLSLVSFSVGAKQKAHTEKSPSSGRQFLEAKKEKLGMVLSENCLSSWMFLSFLFFVCTNKTTSIFHGSNCYKNIIYVEVKKLSKWTRVNFLSGAIQLFLWNLVVCFGSRGWENFSYYRESEVKWKMTTSKIICISNIYLDSRTRLMKWLQFIDYFARHFFQCFTILPSLPCKHPRNEKRRQSKFSI